MILHAFYNPNHVGDVLLCCFTNGQHDHDQKIGDICYIFNSKDEIIGMNVLNASSYFHIENVGQVKITDELVEKLNQMIDPQSNFTVEKDTKERLIVGKVVEIEEHPDSDHLHVCRVDLGDEVTQIVCGAPNVALNQKVVVATIGTMMPNGQLIVPSKLRKVDSNGMLCSARELYLPNAPQVRGILVLDDDYEVGKPFLSQFKGGL